jgi:hypothetical protein
MGEWRPFGPSCPLARHTASPSKATWRGQRTMGIKIEHAGLLITMACGLLRSITLAMRILASSCKLALPLALTVTLCFGQRTSS